MTPFEASVSRIRMEARSIAADAALISSTALDLTGYDLSAAERELRAAADQVSELRKRVAGE